MAVTYGSSVTLPVWAVSHQPVPLSNPTRLPDHPSLSLSSFLLLPFMLFCFLLRGCQVPALLLLLSPPSLPHLTLTTPTSSIFFFSLALPLISVKDVCQNFSCDKAQLSAGKPAHLSLLSWRTLSLSLPLSLTFSYKTILGPCPIRAPR